MFTQTVEVIPAYDKRHDDPSKNYGIGACRIRFTLKGPKGAVQFMIGTNWYLPEQQKNKDIMSIFDQQPQGWDLGYHSPTPLYDNQSSMKCDIIDEERCYYDGSTLNADEMIPDFLAGGTEYLWPKLEEFYKSVFGEDDDSSIPKED